VSPEQIRTIADDEAREVAAVLAQGANSEMASSIAAQTAERTERRFLPMFTSVACKVGCSWCCRGLKVDAFAHEAVAIAEHLRDTLSEEDLGRVRHKVSEHASRVRDLTVRQRFEAHLPCPLLEDDRCSVYELRPLRCRSHHSLAASDCETAWNNPSRDLPITRYHDIVDGYQAVMTGESEAMTDAGVDARCFDLSLALDVALAYPDAAARWARGDRLFDAARFVWRDQGEGGAAFQLVKSATRQQRNRRKRERRDRTR
jgi:Fe-S-cluster containining protein